MSKKLFLLAIIVAAGTLIVCGKTKVVDYSQEYYDLLTIIEPNEEGKIVDIDVTRKKADYTFDVQSFFTSRIVLNCDGKVYESEVPSVGILGEDFKRVEMFFDENQASQQGLTFKVGGKTKTFGSGVCPFTGTFTIKKIYSCIDTLSDVSAYVVGTYVINEDPKAKGSGVFKGTYFALAYIDEENRTITLDETMGPADGYENRVMVGTWTSYKTKKAKRCIFSDGRYPYSEDFDIGDGEMRVNPKYEKNGWDVSVYDSPAQNEAFTYEETPCGIYIKHYNNPWWK